jgi:hypothetical protein
MKRLAMFLLTVLGLFALAACVAVPPPAGPVATAAAPVAPAAAKAPEATKAPVSEVVLKLEGPGGTKSLTLDDLKAVPATEGWAGIKSSTGRITIPERFKGVALDDLAKLVGGLGSDMGVNLAAKDGYAMTVSSDQIAKGDFIAYDPATGDGSRSPTSSGPFSPMKKKASPCL